MEVDGWSEEAYNGGKECSHAQTPDASVAMLSEGKGTEQGPLAPRVLQEAALSGFVVAAVDVIETDATRYGTG